MPHPLLILDPNLIPQQHLRARPRLPAPIAGSREHEPTSPIHVNGRNYASTMARDDREGYCAVSGLRVGLRGLQVVDAEDVVGGAERWFSTEWMEGRIER